jgi:hypothetical protein
MSRWRTLLLAAFALATAARQSRAQSFPGYQHVALGIASPGPGISIMGHAFLLFLNDPNKKSESTAIQYNLISNTTASERKSLVQEVWDFLGYSKIFQIQVMSGLLLLDSYRLENRADLLFYIGIPPSAVRDLWTNLIAERQSREAHPVKDFSFLDHNCLTEALRALNRVIPDPRQHFFFFDHERKVETAVLKHAGLAALYVKNAPFGVTAQLLHHPLVNHVEVIAPVMVSESREYMDLANDLHSFGQRCDPSNMLNQNVESLIGKTEIRESKAFLDFLQDKAQACLSEPQSRDQYLGILKMLYLLSPSLEGKMKIETYFR